MQRGLELCVGCVLAWWARESTRIPPCPPWRQVVVLVHLDDLPPPSLREGFTALSLAGHCQHLASPVLGDSGVDRDALRGLGGHRCLG